MTQRQIPKLQTRATFQPSTWNADSRTVEVVWSTGAEVRRADWWSGEQYIEQLSMSADAVDLSRLNAGAPVLNSHDSGSLDSVIGVVDRAWLANGEGRATVQFSSREDVQPIIQDVRDGILRNISVGYRVDEYTVTQPDQRGELPVYTATRWQPMEISLVPIPADAGAQVRGADDFNPVTIRGMTMTDDVKPEIPVVDEPVEVTPSVDIEQVRHEAAKAERARVADIRSFVRKAALDDGFADALIDSGMAFSEAKEKIMERWSAKVDASINPAGSHVTLVSDEADHVRDGASEYLLHRCGRVAQLSDNGRRFYGDSLLDIAKRCIGRPHGLGKHEIVARALSSSDFPAILANLTNKTLRQAYQEQPRTYQPITNVVQVPDFKTITRTQLSGAPSLAEIPEGGEYTSGSLSDAKEQYAVKTYGKKLMLTRQAIINDDLSAFNRLAVQFAASAAALESDLVWEQITSNPTMHDSTALFHANHGNLGTTGAISVTTLGEARALMRVQTGLEGRKLNLMPSYLIVPAVKEVIAQQYTSQQYVSAKSSDINPFAGALQVIVEPRLDAASTTAYYLAASPAMVDVLELAYLDGTQGVYTEEQMDFDTDGFAIKARLDVGAKVIDWRGLVKNAGA